MYERKRVLCCFSGKIRKTQSKNLIIGLLTEKSPAPAVSSVKVVGAQIKSDGYVYVSVQVARYGKNIYTTYDGMQCIVASTTSVGRPIVTGYIYEVKCAKAIE